MTNAANEKQNIRTRFYLGGALLGAALGLLGGYLFARSAEDEIARKGEIEPIKPFDLLLIAGSVLALLRQITELSSRK